MAKRKNKQKKNKKYIFRNASITATFSMSLVLFMVGLLALSLFLSRDMSNYVRENLNLSIVLKDDITRNDLNKISKKLEKSTFTKSFEYISKEQALEEHIASLGENPEEFLGFNPLLASYEVKLKADYANNDSVANIEKMLTKFSGIERVSYQKDVMDMVNENIRKIGVVIFALALVLMLISFALINNTVRLRVYSNRFLINTMKLVGAKSWFIRKPYIWQSIVNGLFAAVIAVLMLTGLVYYFKYQFGLDTEMITAQTTWMVVVIVFVSGVLLSAISSYFAVGRYLRMRTDDMYFV